MEIKFLNEFRTLAEICNYQEAADQLYISLSTLSKHIAKMEDELGVPLFDRTTRKVSLTKYGTLLYEYAVQMIGSYNDCLVELENLLLDDSLRLTIAFPPPLTEYDLPKYLADFMRDNPQIQATIIEHAHPKELLLEKKCDVAFHMEYGEYHPVDCGLCTEVDSLVAVLPRNHPLAGEAFLTMEQLKDERFIIKSEPASDLSRIFRKICADAGFEPRVACAVRYSSAMPKMVNVYNGVAVTNRQHVHVSEQYEVAVLDILPKIPFHIYMLGNTGGRNSAAMQTFKTYFCNIMNFQKSE